MLPRRQELANMIQICHFLTARQEWVRTEAEKPREEETKDGMTPCPVQP